MDISANTILKGLMTQKEIDESHERLAKIGLEGSKARELAFDLMKLAESVRQATIPNQEFFYEVANLEQYAFHLHAFKQMHNMDYPKIRDGLNWLREQGLIEQSFIIPDCLETLKIKARYKIQERNEILKSRREEAENEKKKGTTSGKSSVSSMWKDLKEK